MQQVLMNVQDYKVKENTLHLSFQGVDEDINRKGSYKIIYVSPGTIGDLSWANCQLMNNGTLTHEAGSANL